MYYICFFYLHYTILCTVFRINYHYHTLSCLIIIIISVHFCMSALFHKCIFIYVFFVLFFLFCVEFKVTLFISICIHIFFSFFSFFINIYIFQLSVFIYIFIIINFRYFCISNSKPKINFENGIGMYIETLE